MLRSFVRWPILAAGLAAAGTTSYLMAKSPRVDFGMFVQNQLHAHAEELFGFRPLEQSALGPYDGLGNLQAIEVATGLTVSLVSSSVASAADQIAFWPDENNPRYLFVCDEETSDPAVQRVDLKAPANANATTIVKGLISCDPVRRTPWGTIIVGEENGTDGGLYEIIDPVSIATPITVSDRAKGTTSDPMHLVKRMAVGALSFEGIGIEPNGTMIYGDENFPSKGVAGGAIFKFVPANAFQGGGPIAVPGMSPLVSGDIFGLRVAASGSTRWGQGAETGNGSWVKVLQAPDVNGNINLRAAAAAQLFTGYYRPEDMDVDPIAAAKGVFRVCWANTGRLSHNDDSIVEDSGVQAEVMCLTENPPSTFNPTPLTGTIPVVDRFLAGSEQRNMFDNVAFQPHTGNLAVIEDGETVSVKSATKTELRGNDL
jgi:hypothetical protein